MISGTNHTFSAQTLMAYLKAVADFPSLSLFLLFPPISMGKETLEALVYSSRNPKALK